VVSNIKEAQKKLKSEYARVQSEQGILRKIPIFGSMYNWWSPVNTQVPGVLFIFGNKIIYRYLDSSKPELFNTFTSIPGNDHRSVKCSRLFSIVCSFDALC